MANEKDQYNEDFNKRYDVQKEKDDKLFIKGFNTGYLLNQHEPELLGRVLKSPNENDVYIDGMKCGKKQQEKDKVLAEIRQMQQSKNKEIER